MLAPRARGQSSLTSAARSSMRASPPSQIPSSMCIGPGSSRSVVYAQELGASQAPDQLGQVALEISPGDVKDAQEAPHGLLDLREVHQDVPHPGANRVKREVPSRAGFEQDELALHPLPDRGLADLHAGWELCRHLTAHAAILPETGPDWENSAIS